jgi:hypothetical protein
MTFNLTWFPGWVRQALLTLLVDIPTFAVDTFHYQYRIHRMPSPYLRSTFLTSPPPKLFPDSSYFAVINSYPMRFRGLFAFRLHWSVIVMS